MPNFEIKIELSAYWHAGSGTGQGARADALIIRDPDGLPYLPGRTLKGLLREGVQLAADAGHVTAETPDLLFGQATTPTTATEEQPHKQGRITIENALLTPALRTWARPHSQEFKQGFTNYASATSVTDEGLARKHSLRVIELATPLTLTAKGTINDENPQLRTALELGARLVKRLGSHRSRGLGRCTVSVTWEPVPKPLTTSSAPNPAESNHVWLRIELESEVIVSANAATVGGHQCLDYLPGGTLLGAAAGIWKRKGGAGNRQFAELFLSGRIRFGDALPLIEADNQLCYPTPLCYQIPKGTSLQHAPVHNAIFGRPQGTTQFQELRGHYLTPKGEIVSVALRYHLKTAIDRTTFGRSRNGQFFDYQALSAGLVFGAQLSWDTDAAQDAKEVLKLLTNHPVRLGRSRSAQFGRVRIQTAPAPKQWSQAESCFAPPPAKPLAVFYCVSDMLPNARADATPNSPLNPSDFGFPQGTARFLPQRSFLRFRRYSPWNYFHGGRESERQVISRGSIITFSLEGNDSPEVLCETARQATEAGGGERRQEGLGQVILNGGMVTQAQPSFSHKRLLPESPSTTHPAPQAPNEPLAAILTARHQEQQQLAHALREGRNLAEQCFQLHQKLGIRGYGKSQWNQVRQITHLKGLSPQDRVDRLRQWCTQASRQEYWLHEYREKTLWKLLQGHLDAPDDPQLDIVHEAAVAMVRLLGRARKGEK